MEILFILAVGVVTLAVAGVVVYIRNRRMKQLAKQYTFIDEENPYGDISTEEEPDEGCPKEVKERLKKMQQELFKEAHKIYLVINNLVANKELPPELKREFHTFVRSYNRIKEMEEEIEVYPFSDCEKVFELKFNFYKRIVEETAKKIMALAKRTK